MNPRPRVTDITELRAWCHIYGTVPTSYRLEGVVRKGRHSRRISPTVEIWEGRYNGEAVALKVVRRSRSDSLVLGTKSVSVPHNP